MKLWVFGDSNSTGYNFKNYNDIWPNLLEKFLGAELKTFAQDGVDNFFIYQSFLSQFDKISNNDLVVIGWSHPSRKTFVYDKDNPYHIKIKNVGTYYNTKPHAFIRSQINKSTTDSIKSVFGIKPKNKGIEYFDNWFSKYYNNVEQLILFQSFLDSVRYKCKAKLIEFYFSTESVKGVNTKSDLFILDEIIDKKFYISENDFHPNLEGHRYWFQRIRGKI